jgi:hypothetical protein
VLSENLDSLGLKYKTDKASSGHNYLKSYEEFLPVRRDEVFTFIEIGVFRGASALMWAEWFPNASIVGLDVKPPKLKISPKNLDLIVGDATEDITVERLRKRFVAPSVVLDDGSHMWDQQRAALQKFWPWLKSGGLYIIEDLQSSYEPGFAREDAFPFAELMVKLAQSIQLRGTELDRFARMGPEWFVNLTRDVCSVNFIHGAVLIRKK